MRIAVFSDNFYPELSGIADSIILLAKELAKLGHEIVFYAPKYSAKNFKTVKLEAKEIDLGNNIKIIRFFSLPFPGPNYQARLVLPMFWRWLTVRKFRPDIIHSQLFFGVGLEALIAAKLLKLPLVGTNHTAITEFVKYGPVKSDFLKPLSLKYAVWYYNHCDFVTAPSQSVFHEMSANGFRRPGQVISNPIDLSLFNGFLLNKKPELKKKFKLSNNTIVYAGRLAPEKNIEVIIKAVALAKKEIPDINFVLAGHGNAEKELMDLTRQLGLINNIKFFATVEQKILAELYQASEVFVIASTSETQSLTLMQAMACGLPAVGVSARALPEYIKSSNGAVVEPGNSRAMAEKISYLLLNPDKRQILSQNAVELAQSYSAPNIAKTWEKVYKVVYKNKTSSF